MTEYVLSPYVHQIESRLDPHNTRFAFFHQLSGYVFEPPANLRHLLLVLTQGSKVNLEKQQLQALGEIGKSILGLIDKQFLLIDGFDSFEFFLDHYIVRPIHNPAVSYKALDGQLIVVRMSMERRICSPTPGEFEAVFEENVLSPAAEILMNAGTATTLRQLFARLAIPNVEGKKAVEFLSSPHRQLIKLAAHNEKLDDPHQWFNTVPRSLYHSSLWTGSGIEDETSVSEFHRAGISNADWEFDVIEPTVNHAFRFRSEALGGLSYGGRFYEAASAQQIFSERLGKASEILEVGGGTGTFAVSFLRQAAAKPEGSLNYHILELSPVLAENQKRLLTSYGFQIEQFLQNAVSFSIPDHKFDLIVANEVIADLPVSTVQKANEAEGPTWMGEGTVYVDRYRLKLGNSDFFRLNSGAFEFIERAWEHLRPGGTAIITEYGFVDRIPVQIFHLNHQEFSIHFGHLQQCAEAIGFTCRLLSLVEFLEINEEVAVFAGNDQHIVCLNHVLSRFNLQMPFAALTESEFETHFGNVCSEIEITGPRFVPLRAGYHYGPPLNEFMVLILRKPERESSGGINGLGFDTRDF